MANANQIYTIVNSLGRQTMGETAVTVTDATSMLSLGNDILSTDKTLDAFVGKLADRIGKTIISMRSYSISDIGIVRHAFEFGVALQKIYVDLPDADQNTSWKVGEQDFKPEYAPVIKPDVRQKIFSNITTFEIDMTIPDTILRTAFTSAQAMAALIDAIFVAIDNRMTQALQACIQLVRASFIARKIKGNKPCGAINVLARYNEEMGETLTVANCRRNVNFLRYYAEQIKLWTYRMRDMSVLFNEEEYKRHTPDADLRLVMLNEMDAALTIYLESNTFHDDLVAIQGKYEVVNYWQGSGTDYAFDSTSEISVDLGGEEGEVTQSGILAVAYDWQAIGVTIDSRKITTERNNRSEYTNYYNKVTRGYFNDMSENGIVFYIAD